jgi:hypothetical protein
LGRVTLVGQAVDLLLLLAEPPVDVGQRGHRGVLAGLGVGKSLVRVLLCQPGRRLLVHLLGASALQVVHHLLGTGGQGLPGGRGGDDVVGTGRLEVAVRRTIDVTGYRETVESILGGRDCDVGIPDRLPVGLDVMLCGRGIVACGFDVDHSLVDALLLGLNLRAEVL